MDYRKGTEEILCPTDTKDLTSSSKFSGFCVLTLQTLPSKKRPRDEDKKKRKPKKRLALRILDLKKCHGFNSSTHNINSGFKDLLMVVDLESESWLRKVVSGLFLMNPDTDLLARRCAVVAGEPVTKGQ